MTSSGWTPLMHSVLDGEATPEEEAALHRRLADDPAARAEFAALQSLFGRMAAVPQSFPPEGLVAAVSTAVGEYSRSDQLLPRSGVFGSTARFGSDDPVDRLPASSARSSRSIFRGISMDQQANTSIGNRKMWVGGGLAVIAVAVIAAFGMSGSPKNEDVNGTIVAAERFRAPQATTSDVQLGDQSVAQLLQNDAFLRVVKDPQVQAFIVDPNFVPASQMIRDDPDGARQALAGPPDAKATAPLLALSAHPDAARLLLANPEANRAMLKYPDASLSFLPPAMRVAAERAASDRTASDRTASDRTASDRTASDRTAADRTASDRTASDRTASDRTASDRTASDRTASDRTASDRTASDRTASDRTASDRTASDRTASDRTASDRTASDRTASDRTASDRTASDRTAADRTASDRTAAERTASDRTAAERTAADRTASGRTASDRTASDRAASERATVDRARVERTQTP